jgi:hypothetical protein
MKKSLQVCSTGLLALLLAGSVAAQSGGQQSAGAQRMQDRITREVRHELVMLGRCATPFSKTRRKMRSKRLKA